MKKSTPLIGFIASLFSIVGMMFKVMHWPGASVLLVLGLGALAFCFLPFYGYSVLYKLSDNKSKAAGLFGSALFMSIALGALFKIQHWPGASMFLFLAFALLVLLVFPALLIDMIGVLI